MLDPLEQLISDLLKSNGATDTQVEYYLDDIFNFGDKRLYDEADDETILNDFNEWLEN